ncbi:S-methyl-5'-thioadenosine phosphorylase [Candidatus Uhrbacteria bacterium]|nr:S-methyl-5'-thioadenosine phosphorylase [Candidatus Uhrbacteria bacterium]
MPETQRYCLAVIGGSGLYEIDGVEIDGREIVDTPFGHPSDAVIRAHTDVADLLFLPRHGRGHRIPPSAINYRANICALKRLGATHVLAISAVGSLRQSIAPGHLVAVNQFLDRTLGRPRTFFDVEGVVAHVAFAEPVCPNLHIALVAATREAERDTSVHNHGTLVVIEGPQFSTRAESESYRAMGADIIGMTALPEARLAREAELPYALLALSTDYDCWHRGEAPVTADAVARVMRENVGKAKRIIPALAHRLPDPTASIAHRALDGAIMTSDAERTNAKDALRRLEWLRPFASATTDA